MMSNQEHKPQSNDKTDNDVSRDQILYDYRLALTKLEVDISRELVKARAQTLESSVVKGSEKKDGKSDGLRIREQSNTQQKE